MNAESMEGKYRRMASQASTEDKKFIELFEACEVAPDDFDHRSHLRMAYTYLCDHDTQATCNKIRHSLCAFLSHVGIEPSSKYHETMTRAWVLAVRHFMACTPGTNSTSEFIDANPRLLDTEIMATHYSKHALFSDAAHSSFIEPDLAPIPRFEEATISSNQASTSL